jgi:hypothetical protein
LKKIKGLVLPFSKVTVKDNNQQALTKNILRRTVPIGELGNFHIFLSGRVPILTKTVQRKIGLDF